VQRSASGGASAGANHCSWRARAWHVWRGRERGAALLLVALRRGQAKVGRRGRLLAAVLPAAAQRWGGGGLRGLLGAGLRLVRRLLAPVSQPRQEPDSVRQAHSGERCSEVALSARGAWACGRHWPRRCQAWCAGLNAATAGCMQGPAWSPLPPAAAHSSSTHPMAHVAAAHARARPHARAHALVVAWHRWRHGRCRAVVGLGHLAGGCAGSLAVLEQGRKGQDGACSGACSGAQSAAALSGLRSTRAGGRAAQPRARLAGLAASALLTAPRHLMTAAALPGGGPEQHARLLPSLAAPAAKPAAWQQQPTAHLGCPGSAPAWRAAGWSGPLLAPLPAVLRRAAQLPPPA
jgi:hypothetical protein